MCFSPGEWPWWMSAWVGKTKEVGFLVIDGLVHPRIFYDII